MRSGEASKPTTSGLRRVERRGQRHVWHDRDVGGLDAAVRQVDACRRFRCSADAEQDDICVVEMLGHLAVVMHHRKVQRVDALEIVGVQHVLRAGSRRRCGPQIGLKEAENRLEHRKARATCFVARALKLVRKVPIDEA